MLEKLRDLVLRLFGVKMNKQPFEPDEYAEHYENIDGENITATIANKLGMLTFADSTCTVDETQGKRAELMAQVIAQVWKDGAWIVAQCFGKGGKVLVPTVHNGHIDVRAVDQNRLVVHRMDGERVMDCTLISDIQVVNDRQYWLLTHYSVDDDTLTIKNKACAADGADVPLDYVDAWAGTLPEITISNVNRCILAFLRCPRDNRRDHHVHGVPITYGAGNDIKELVEHIRIYQREFKLTRPMLGLDSTLWKGSPNANSIDRVRKTVQDGDDPFIPVDTVALDSKTPWQMFAPAIRVEAMETRYNSLLRRVEKACGLSQGILTERQGVNYANKDEVRAAQYDTFATIKAMREAWEHAMDDLCYAIDVLAEYYGLTPAGARGEFEVAFDWDTSMIESSSEAFAQNSELQSRGLISGAELRQWVRGGTLEENQQALDEIKASGEGESGIETMLKRLQQPQEE